ncbi:MAG: kinase/pyrophosphorylase, partial [Anaerococcus hydrogenalis]|nr:kinase/pyrophosphorylase [Anaerococcus hydrogenalis]
MKLIVNIISDTSGYATEQIVKVSLSQFNVETITNIYSDIRDEKSLEDILNFIIETGDNFIIYHSFQDSKMNAY